MITILGASGFIGSHLVKYLQSNCIEHYAPHRNENYIKRDLGNVIYCIGLTADFRKYPLKAVEAHVCKLLNIVQTCRFNSLLYLSSTRLYSPGTVIAHEDDTFKINSSNPSDLYNISKIMGESLLLACGHKVKIARISNVYGDDVTSENFLTSIIKEAIVTKKLLLGTSLDSEKDYISIDNIVTTLLKISLEGKHQIYNVASGINISNAQLTNKISQLTDCQVEVQPNAKTIIFPPISIERVLSEFPYESSNVLNDLEKIVNLHK